MSRIDSIEKILATANGTRVGGRELLPGKKTDFISEDVKQKLLDQWDTAGRDAARIYLKFVEENGTDLFVTGWDGFGNFVGYETDKGFGYIPSARLQIAKLDEKWDTEVSLGLVRQNLEEMDRGQVADLVKSLHKRLSKRGKGRRFNEARNAMKHILNAMSQSQTPSQTESEGNTWRSDAMMSKQTIKQRKAGVPPLVGKGKSTPKGKNGLYSTDGNRMKPSGKGFSESIASFRALTEAADPEVKSMMKNARKAFQGGWKDAIDKAAEARGAGYRGPKPISRAMEAPPVSQSTGKYMGKEVIRGAPLEFKRGSVSKSIEKLRNSKKGK